MEKSRYKIPIEIQESLDEFRRDYTLAKKIAFLMMKFDTSAYHKKIVKAIKEATEKNGITAIRADEKEYHVDLYWNVMTYVYGCNFGIAVFDRISSNDFSPNVSYEVGYLTALGKPVCMLKDHTLVTLPADLVGKLYRPFDTRSPSKTVTASLLSWLRQKSIITA